MSARGESTLTLCSGEQAGTHPVSEALACSPGRGPDERVIVRGEAHGPVDGARVVKRWPAGSWAHGLRIAATESLDNDYLCGNNKAMTTTIAQATGTHADRDGYITGIATHEWGFVAMTRAESKTFKTARGAVAWLAVRGYGPNGVHIS